MAQNPQQPFDLPTSLAHVRAGGLPIRAQMRLAEEAGPHRRLFTSDLSVSEFLLVEEAKKRIVEVMSTAVKLDVPLVVEAGAAKNWDAAKS